MTDTKASTTEPDGKENTIASARKRGKKDSTAPDDQQRRPSVRQSKTGRLSQFMNMPMDVLMEVVIHVFSQNIHLTTSMTLDIWSSAPARFTPFSPYHDIFSTRLDA